MHARRMICLIGYLLFLSATAHGASLGSGKVDPCTTLILVRHAEKRNETDTTTLTAAGYERADRLARLLSNTQLDAIYTTPFIRMQLTAAPTAAAKQLPIQDYQPHKMDEIERMVQQHTGKVILVIGHGNTIPSIINQFCGTTLPNLEGYNDLFILTIADLKQATNVYLRLFY